jgi:hypothetical protein
MQLFLTFSYPELRLKGLRVFDYELLSKVCIFDIVNSGSTQNCFGKAENGYKTPCEGSVNEVSNEPVNVQKS